MRTCTLPGLLSLLGVVSMVMLYQCSGNPTLADGTHTGNPDVAACAAAIRDLSLESGQWHIENYVSAERLDPASIDPRTDHGPILAKRQTGVMAWSDTLILTDTLYRDTFFVLQHSPLIVNDTIIDTYVQSDTVDTIIDGRSYKHVEKTMITDSVYVNDTIVKVDTVFFTDTVVVRDTIYPSDKAPAGSPGETQKQFYDSANWYNRSNFDVSAPAPAYQYSTYNPELKLAEHVFASPAGDEAAVITSPAKFDLRDNARTDVVELSALFPADSVTTVRITYSDADGDNLLFEAASGATPAARLTEVRQSTNADQRLTVLFDAGADIHFGAIADNAVATMNRVSTESGDTVQTIRFEKGANDSLRMTIDRNRPSREVDKSQSVFVSLDGSLRSARDDRLVQMRHMRRYRRKDIYQIHLTLTPAAPRERTQSLEACSFSARIVHQDDTEAAFSGIVNESGVIIGDYTYYGTIMRLTVDPDGKQVISEETR